MRKPSVILLLIIFLGVQSSKAQKLKHYFSYSTVPYINLFNKEKEDFPIRYMLKLPAFSYSIEKGKMGFGFFFIHNETSYYKFSSYESLPNPDSNIITTDIYSIGLTAHYRVFERKWIRINSMIGLTYHWYKATCLESWSVMNRNPDFTWYEPHFYSQKESKLGAIVGINLNFPIYKGIYANTDIRYSFFPTANYNKQNLIWEIGIGYMLYRK